MSRRFAPFAFAAWSSVLELVTSPTISGSGAVGAPLQASSGAWDVGGGEVPIFSYQWLLDGVAISGANSAAYTPSAPQDGGVVSVRVTATSGRRVGSVTVTGPTVSTATGKESYAPPPLVYAPTDPGVVMLSPGSNVQSVINSNPAGTTYYLPNGVYANFSSVSPKQGDVFFGQSEASTIIRGAPSRRRAFHSTSDDLTFWRFTIEDFGDPNGTFTSTRGNQGVAALDPRIGEARNSANHGKDWRVSELTFRDNNDVGIWYGPRMIVDGCSFYGHSPAAILAGYWVGGLIYDNYFAPDNGLEGAPGDGVNNAQIKLTWGNIGPWGQTDRDITRHNTQNGQPYGNFVMDEPLSILQVIGNHFDGDHQVNQLWFDLDVRDVEVAYNLFDQGYEYGVFFEGCNNGWVHHNTFEDCGGQIGPGYVAGPTGPSPNARYYQNAAVATGSSDNILVEDNTFNNCDIVCIFFLGARGVSGADWWLGGGYPVVYWGWMQNVYTPIDPAETSSVGASSGTFRNNVLTGSSKKVGVVVAGNMAANTKNLDTYSFSGNDYGANTQFYWDGSVMDEAAWNAAGRS